MNGYYIRKMYDLMKWSRFLFTYVIGLDSNANNVNQCLVLKSHFQFNRWHKFVGAWSLQGVKGVPQGFWPQFCQVGWRWMILDTHGKLLGVKNSAALQFLT